LNTAHTKGHIIFVPIFSASRKGFMMDFKGGKSSSCSLEQDASADLIFETLGAFDSLVVKCLICFPNLFSIVIFKIECVFDDLIFGFEQKQTVFNRLLNWRIFQLIKKSPKRISALEEFLQGRVAC
jgi:hypothetical protein